MAEYPGSAVAAEVRLWLGMSLAEIAKSLGSSEQALRLILSIFLGYPFALFQRYFLFQKNYYLIHLYNTIMGLSVAYFNFGAQFCHSLICVFVQFLILRLMGRTVTAIATTFCFQMTYLMAGYYFTATEHYDIKWTMPHCVLTLKLIGLVIDYYEGRKEEESLTPDQQQFAVRGVPTLLEVSGFSYFYGAFMVGPQFSMTRYLKLVKGELTDVPGQRPNSFVPALKRLLLGIFFMIIYTVASPYISEEYLTSDDYLEQPFWFRCFYILIWGKIMLYKYVTCWLVTEGVCILTGLGYNGRDEKGLPQWDACANMKVWMFETTPYFTGTIASFNTNTNTWVARYIYKRLKFLGNKLLSQAVSLLFLSVWHGLHCGYLICFQMEFLIVIVERQAINLIKDNQFLTALASNIILRPFFYVIQQTIHWMFMGYSLVPFCLFSWEKWIKVPKQPDSLEKRAFPLYLLAGERNSTLTSSYSFTGIQVYLFHRPCVVLHVAFYIAFFSESTCATKRKAKES